MSETQKRNMAVNIIFLTIIGIFTVFAYKTTLMWMYDRYMGADSYYSHGFIVPFISLYFIYLQKENLAQIKPQTSVIGLIILFFALLLHILGTLLYIFSISGFSIFFLIIGLSIFLFGKEISKVIWFPLLFLVFMFPLPEAMISLVSFPLKIFAAKAGVWIISILGIPIYLEGFNILIPAGPLLVGNPCSGLRSLIAFLALGSIFAYLEPISIIKKWFLFSLSIPIALLSNIVRIPILILVSNYWGLEAAGPDTLVHTGSGILVFVLGFLLIFTAARALEWRT
ncbi:MAG: exosortase/archaeosortase family protein [Desulfobacula sp.]|uniref:exosortase/archaeosortase family protein n=1 Tax=Desulfobacula sp. TaxID=2593537 RepID=UPI001D40CC9A|nr:exosortase/archaeosortase family protein [Desulfobacula sp.]MBT4026463.1 exosortase/archaeosortase family protein [Desulfobacula sp.]MBT4200308.1 exosortase/archaeosortase family protein [Desulfobacula sp.]MBT4508879.1 exosortase/archaeosortase family protein [Desulfobacula sp.]MBT4874633.1 exosortase/archaeosortase family protein [Desulfobacula sp.]